MNGFLVVEREGNDPTSSGVSDQRSDLISYLSICMGGIFIEHHAAGSPTVHNEGARRFDAHYLSRNSIRLSRKHLCVSNHFDVIINL